ncbi:alpha/beta fold hydrolase [Mangrovicoccus algicola]|uniref:Alpha/beta hydrolase n=1 Tax=Mangrovicoccus algicola TaxID=2771008 RepID=A0A8J6YZ20_9RHOB|nr:alpha/beta hydrolase [Mangrovicoccus algicola]MBE3638423.1 alpha/beta hydrolase [Mangrovicoccus algicola]
MIPLPPHLTLAEGPAARPPVALFHGFLESPAMWQALPPRLWAGRDAVALPLPGHAPWLCSGAALEDLLRDDAFLDSYAALLERLRPGEPWRLVGHSTGAMVALALARRAPHLVSDICAVAPLFSGRVAGRGMQGALARLPILGPMGFRWMMARWLARPDGFRRGVAGVTRRPGARLEMFDGVRADLVAADPAQIYRFGQWIGAKDMTADLHALDRPVHAIICDRDPVVVPQHQLALISAARGASATVLRSGHLPMLETPAAFARVFLAWRNRHGAAAVDPGFAQRHSDRRFEAVAI